jgi:acid stress chaperone HdeB
MIAKLLAGLSLPLLFATCAYAQVSIDASKITCEQYVFSKVATPRSIALWMSGYYSGKRNSSVVDVQAFEANADKMERFCKQQENLKMPLMQAIEKALGPGK